jgi:hypothetical protein
LRQFLVRDYGTLAGDGTYWQSRGHEFDEQG